MGLSTFPRLEDSLVPEQRTADLSRLKRVTDPPQEAIICDAYPELPALPEHKFRLSWRKEKFPSGQPPDPIKDTAVVG